MDVKVGDRLLKRSTSGARYGRPGEEDEEVIVYKVGRKYGYAVADGSEPVAEWMATRFDLETGYEPSGQFASSYRVLTHEMDADEKRRQQLTQALNERGLASSTYSGLRAFSTAKLERILAVIDEY